MGIRNNKGIGALIIAILRIIIILYLHFRYLIANLLTVPVSRQSIPGVTPSCCLTECYRIPDSIILQQLNRNRGRSHIILVILIIPHLADCPHHGCRNMGVGDSKHIIRLVICHFRSIYSLQFICLNLYYFIIDQHSLVLILIQILPGVAPIRCCKNYRILIIHTIRFQLYGNLTGPYAILIVVVLPTLDDRAIGGIRFVAINDFTGIAVLFIRLRDLSNITLCCNFLTEGIADKRALVVILGKIFKRPLPLICRRYCLAVNLLIIRKQIHGNTFRPFTILVIGIIPGLLPLDLYSLRSVGIGNNKSGLPIRRDYGSIAITCIYLFNAPYHRGAVYFILRQVFKDSRPVIPFI